VALIAAVRIVAQVITGVMLVALVNILARLAIGGDSVPDRTDALVAAVRIDTLVTAASSTSVSTLVHIEARSAVSVVE